MADEARPQATLERVPISKLRASDINQRTKFEGLEELAAEFDDNPVFPGEPWTPIMVYRDGNVFRIVDGERRFRAMKKAKKVKECNAYVFDSMEDAVAVLVVLDTDSKQRLSEGERSAGLQTALKLGVPEKKIEARAGMKCAAALKRQMKRQGGKPCQLSVEQILAADEFADDQDDYDAIMGAGDSWQWKARNIRNRREEAKDNALAEAAAAEAAEKHGLQVADKPPKAAILERTLYRPVADNIAKYGEEWAKEGATLVRPRKTSYGHMTNWEVYSMPPGRTPEEEAAAKSKSALRRQVQAGNKRRLEWVAKRMLEAGAMHGLPNLRKHVRDYILANGMHNVEKFCKAADVDSDFFNDGGSYRIPSEYVIADNWEYMTNLSNHAVDAIGDGTAKGSAMMRHDAERHVKLMKALRLDGYEPDDEEKAFVELCLKATAGD